MSVASKSRIYERGWSSTMASASNRLRLVALENESRNSMKQPKPPPNVHFALLTTRDPREMSVPSILRFDLPREQGLHLRAVQQPVAVRVEHPEEHNGVRLLQVELLAGEQASRRPALRLSGVF